MKLTPWKRWAPSGLTFVSGALIVVAFPPWNLWPLAWIFLVPWLIALKKAPTVKDAVIQSVWLSYFMSLGGFAWVAFALQEFGGLNWGLSILGLQLFCIFGQPQFVAYAVLFKKLQLNQKRALSGAFLLAFAYTGIDWISPKLFMDTLGHVFYRAQNVRQLADLGGAPLLTFLLFFWNNALADAFVKWREKKRFQLLPQFAAAILICSLGWGYGHFRYNEITRIVSESKNGIQAAAIQGNIGDFDKVAAERGLEGAAFKVLDTFSSLTDQAFQLTPRPDFIIWPETSYPATFRTPHSLTESKLDDQLEAIVKKHKIPLLFGGYDHSNGKDYNAFFFLSPLGDLQIYRKNILLLFGEYIPGASLIPFIKESFPQVGNFGRGPGPQVLTVVTSKSENNIAHVGPLICYEALFPNFVIEAARQGSQIIMNITNDSWFGTWGEPHLHLALTTFRSIETRLPMIRTTNTGISALVTADGEITNATEIGTQKIMNVYVPITAPIPTLMKMWGDWFGIFSLFLGLLGVSAYFLKQKKTKPSSKK